MYSPVGTIRKIKSRMFPGLWGGGQAQFGVSARPLEWSPCSWSSPNGTKAPEAGGKHRPYSQTNVCSDGSYSSGGGRLECEAGHPLHIVPGQVL